MSGHSKWAKIKRDKGANDAKKGILFSKLSKKITLAAKSGGSSDPTKNFQLRSEIESAKALGMPNDNIDRAAKKAFDKDAVAISEIVYEGYGPFGTAFLVEVATDNTNRSVQNVKHIFSKHGGSLGTMGSVAWQFETKGQILLEKVENSKQQLALSEIELRAIDAGAVDVRESEEGLEIYTKPEDLLKIKTDLEALGAKIVQAEVVKESTQIVELSDDQRAKVEALLSEMEEYEDVVAVYTNANL